MFTFYDSSNGSIQSLPEDYLRLSLKEIKNAIYQKSQIQSEKQILLSPQGHEINEANRAIYLTASESQALVRHCVGLRYFMRGLKSNS